MNTDGSGRGVVTGAALFPGVAWSSDGQHADGSGQRRLTRTPAMAKRHFAWHAHAGHGETPFCLVSPAGAK